MAIKAVVEKDKFEEEVPEQYRDLYTERNGKMEITAVEGMKTQADIDRLQTSLNKERKEHKDTKTKFAPLADRDITEVVAILDEYPVLKEAAEGKLDDKKIDKIVEQRITAKIAPVQRELEQTKAQLVEKDKAIETFNTKERVRTIKDSVREAVSKSQGFVSTAQDDVLDLAERVFTVDEHGKVITKDDVGVTPGVEPAVWLTDMQKTRPHWWGTTQGGGARGGNAGANGSGNPFSHSNWNVTEQGRIAKENPARAEQLAKAAGTTVGGLKPAAPSK